jgi:LAO/AO transport system kinase
MSGAELAQAARAGSRRDLARLLTAVESRSKVAEEGVRELYSHGGAAHIVGITGPPGAGKSSLVAALVSKARAAQRTVAVLAIDPSSPITGGAILGDRVRMQQHAGDDGVFIRSMASRGHAGGLAGTTAEAAAVLDACGFELILIETVGTGQSEVEVAAVADTTVVVQAPEAGDEVQAIKAGLLEVADIVVVNKADRPGADKAAAHLHSMLTVSAREDEAAGGRPRPKRPAVLLTSATEGDGVADLLDALDRRYRDASDNGQLAAARTTRSRSIVEAILADRTRASMSDPNQADRIAEILAAVATNNTDPYTAADRLEEARRP